MGKKYSRLWRMGITVLIFTVLSTGMIALAKKSDPQMTGLPKLTQEELDWQNKHMLRVKKVKVNQLGRDRINRYLNKQGRNRLSPLQLSIAAPGNEIEGEIGIPGEQAAGMDVSSAAAMPATLPVSVDNSELKYFPPIRSQGSLPSCGAFSGTYYTMTHMHAMANDIDAKSGGDSVRFSPKWVYNMVNTGALNGSWYYWAYNIGQKHGAATWAEFPYDSNYRAWCMDPAVWRNAIDRRFDQAGYVADTHMDTGIEQVKQLLVNGYVLNFPTYINSWQYKTIGNDPATNEDDAFVGKTICYWVNGTAGYHAMTVVGYNDDIWVDINNNGAVDIGEKGAFRIANSWGTGWGEAGYAWMAYDALKNPSAVPGGPEANRIHGWTPTRAHWVTARNNYTPALVAVFTLHHALRNQIRVTLGVSGTNEVYPIQTWLPDMIYSDGGAYAFNGTTTACDGTFVFDFTDVIPQGGDNMRYYIGVQDTITGNVVTLKEYSILDVSNAAGEVACNTVPVSGDNEQLHEFVDYNFSDGNLSPVASATATPDYGTAPLTVLLDAGDSYDSDGAIVAHEWDFGDGTTGQGVVITHVYTTPGTYETTLRVTDDRTAANEDWLTIVVAPDPDKVLFVDDINMSMQTVDKWLVAHSTVCIRDIHNNPVENATVSGNWSGLVSGTGAGITDADGMVSFTSLKTKKTGRITFSVTAVSAAGFAYNAALNNETQDNISTAQPMNQIPVAKITVSQTTGIAPLLVQFDGSASSDSDGQIVSYLWNFGNGASAATETASILYDTPGIYDAILTVTDDKGATGTATISITVMDTFGPVVYIDQLSITLNNADRKVFAEATVLLMDTEGNPVPGAAVTGQFSTLVSGGGTVSTDASGIVTFLSKSTPRSGTITFTVNSVSAQGYLYDPSLNIRSSISVENP